MTEHTPPPAATTPTIVPMTDLAALRAAGIEYPATIDGWRWLYRTRHERGLAGAFRRVGKRIVVDTTAYLAALRATPAA